MNILENLPELTDWDLGLLKKEMEKTKLRVTFFPYAFANNNTPNPLQVTIRGLGLEGKVAGDKFIPHQYKVASVEDRFRLLAGLLDTDAFYDKEKNTFEYCSKSKRLADDVVFVCRSLGFFAQIGKTKVVREKVITAFKLVVT